MTDPFSPEQRLVLEMAINFIHSATIYLVSVAPIADEVDKRMLEALIELGEMCLRRLPQNFPELQPLAEEWKKRRGV